MARRKKMDIEQHEPNWDDIRTDWDKKVEELEQKARRIDVLKEIYEKVVSAMQWECMEYHSSDEEHEDTWFTYDPESYHAWKYPIYQEVLAKIAEMANEE